MRKLQLGIVLWVFLVPALSNAAWGPPTCAKKLGLRIKDSQTGVHVLSVEVAKGARGAKSGLQKNDYIIEMNGRPVITRHDFERACAAVKGRHEFTVLRGGHKIQTKQ